jgi:hypothetical protein
MWNCPIHIYLAYQIRIYINKRSSGNNELIGLTYGVINNFIILNDKLTYCQKNSCTYMKMFQIYYGIIGKKLDWI